MTPLFPDMLAMAKSKFIRRWGFQSFLDNVQYKAIGILRYERIFGDGYVSTGGAGERTHPILSFFL
jgi:hypothetical protein